MEGWHGGAAGGRGSDGAPAARLPGRLPPSAGLSDPRNQPLPRAVPHPPLLPDPPSLPSALRAPGAKVSVREPALAGAHRPASQPPPLAPGSGDAERPRRAGAPGRARGEPGERRPYLPPPGPRRPRCGPAGRGALAGSGLTARRRLRRAQSPKPAARSPSPWIFREKKKRLVGAATPGGVGRGGGESADPEVRAGAAHLARESQGRLASREPLGALGRSESEAAAALHPKAPKGKPEGLANLAAAEKMSLERNIEARPGRTGERGGAHVSTQVLGK